MEPYIFFDVDGVLNNESDWRTTRYHVRDSCVSVLSNFATFLKKKYGEKPKLIICSTWRTGTEGQKGRNYVTGLEMKLKSQGLYIHGSTPVSSKTRQEEIEYYIRRNSISNYIVIDDDASLYCRPSEINLYVPNYKTGLVKKDLKLLEKQFAKYGGKK